MNVDMFSLRPRGSKISIAELSLREKLIKKLSSDFNVNKTNAKFDIGLLDRLKENNDCADYITPMWSAHLDRIEHLIREQDRAILLDRLVRYAVYLSLAGEWSDIQLPYLENSLSSMLLSDCLLESSALDHNIIHPLYKTSESRINHLTHLVYFQEIVNKNISDMKHIVEFGGGYGGMTLLLKKLAPNATIVVIDVPAMIVLQSYYVSQSLGRDIVNVIESESEGIREGLVNFVPLSRLNQLSREFRTDLFVATWSLSEANDRTVDLVESFKLFGAQNILFGYRFYPEVNPRQPLSRPTPSMLSRDAAFHGPAFWCLDREQYYLFV
jgi:hypothetical protein